MKEELIKEKLRHYDMVGNMREDLRTVSAKYDLSYMQQDTVYENYANKNMAKNLIDMGWAKSIWHKVADGDLPKEDHEVIFVSDTGDHYSGVYVKITNSFYTEGDIKHNIDEVIAWTELPEYKG